MAVVLLMACECGHLFPGTDCIAGHNLHAPRSHCLGLRRVSSCRLMGAWGIGCGLYQCGLRTLPCMWPVYGTPGKEESGPASHTLPDTSIPRALRASMVVIPVALAWDRQYVFTTARDVRASPVPVS